jgi:hypothetical protein
MGIGMTGDMLCIHISTVAELVKDFVGGGSDAVQTLGFALVT